MDIHVSAMATTTATATRHQLPHQQRYHPNISEQPIDAARGFRRDSMVHAAKHNNSSRQTMTTEGSSNSRLSANNSDLERLGHARLLDNSANNNHNYTPNTSSRSGFSQHQDRERQRRAEENAAFVKMLEEESFMLQGGRLPKKQMAEKERRERCGSGDLDAFPHPASVYSPNRRHTYQEQQQQHAARPNSNSRSRSNSLQRGRYSPQPSAMREDPKNLTLEQKKAQLEQLARDRAQFDQEYLQRKARQEEEARQKAALEEATKRQHHPHQQSGYHPHQLYSPYRHFQDDDEEEDHRAAQRNDGYASRHHHNRDIPLEVHQPYNNHHDHNRDIPLELSIPTNPKRSAGLPMSRNSNSSSKASSKASSNRFVPPPNPLVEQQQQQQEFELDFDVEELRKSNHSGDRRHPSQLRLLTRQPNEKSMNAGRLSPRPPPHHPQHHQQQEYPLGLQPPNTNNMMSLEEAIHSLELEGKQQAAAAGDHSPYARRELPDDYDAILTGGDKYRRHNSRSTSDHHHYNPHHSSSAHRKQEQQFPQDNRGQSNYHSSRSAPKHHQDIVLDRYSSNNQRAEHPQQAPPHPPHHQYHPQAGGPPARLMHPVEWVEFPVDWDGREIETTEDDELLDRDEDEYYRRRAQAYRQQQQQQQRQQQSLQSLQSQSLQSQSLQSQSQSQAQTPQQGGRNRTPMRRVQSNLSRESLPYGPPGHQQHHHASDLYSQTMAHNGRRVPMQIEVSPGVSMPFRGSEETWEAIALNRIVRTSCLGCSIQLYCVEDAELVVCPDCQTMSPAHATEDPKANRTGLGLGFKEEQLVQWRNAGP